MGAKKYEYCVSFSISVHFQNIFFFIFDKSPNPLPLSTEQQWAEARCVEQMEVATVDDRIGRMCRSNA